MSKPRMETRHDRRTGLTDARQHDPGRGGLAPAAGQGTGGAAGRDAEPRGAAPALLATAIGVLAVALTALGCATTPAPQEEAGEAEEVPARIETRWTDTFEWFVEHPMPVVGEEMSFAAHLTWLDGFRPVEEGRLVVELRGAGGEVLQRVEADAPSRSGIFVPVLVPGQAGEGSLRLVYEGPGGVTDETGWGVRVAASVDDLGVAPAEPEGVGFLKEQQWRMPFGTAAASRRSLTETIELPAAVEAHPRHVAEVAAPAAGVLMAPEAGLPVPGTQVRRGDVLALVSPPLGSGSGWHTLQAELTEARNRLAHAEHEHGRAARLVEAGAVPARRLQTASLELDNAAARLSVLERRAERFAGVVGSAAARGEAPAALPLRAPVDGTVSVVRVTAGEPVDVDRRLFRIVGLDPLVVRVEVPEGVLHRLLEHSARGESLPASIALPGGGAGRMGDAGAGRDAGGGSAAGAGEGGDAAGWRATDDLLELGTEVDPGSLTAPVRYTVSNDDRRLRPGMALQARIRIGDAHELLAVPEAAIVEVDGLTVAYVQVSGETFEERIVETGMREGGWIEIRSGIAEGERVVSTGAYGVRLAALSPDSAPAAHSH